MKNARIFFLLVLLTFSGRVNAQEADSVAHSVFYRNSVYAELLGNGEAGSVNYERLVGLENSGIKLAFRVGGLYLPKERETDKQNYTVFCPVEISVFWDEKYLKPELGFGFTYFYSSDSFYSNGREKTDVAKGTFQVLRLGLRIQDPGKRYVLRIALMPMFSWQPQTPIINYIGKPLIWAGLSLGYSFGKSKVVKW